MLFPSLPPQIRIWLLDKPMCQSHSGEERHEKVAHTKVQVQHPSEAVTGQLLKCYTLTEVDSLHCYDPPASTIWPCVSQTWVVTVRPNE